MNETTPPSPESQPEEKQPEAPKSPIQKHFSINELIWDDQPERAVLSLRELTFTAKRDDEVLASLHIEGVGMETKKSPKKPSKGKAAKKKFSPSGYQLLGTLGAALSKLAAENTVLGSPLPTATMAPMGISMEEMMEMMKGMAQNKAAIEANRAAEAELMKKNATEESSASEASESELGQPDSRVCSRKAEADVEEELEPEFFDTPLIIEEEDGEVEEEEIPMAETVDEDDTDTVTLEYQHHEELDKPTLPDGHAFTDNDPPMPRVLRDVSQSTMFITADGEFSGTMISGPDPTGNVLAIGFANGTMMPKTLSGSRMVYRLRKA